MAEMSFEEYQKSQVSKMMKGIKEKAEDRRKKNDEAFKKKTREEDKKAGGGYMQSKGGAAGGVKKKKVASNVSSRADGIVKKGRTKGRII